MNSPAGGWAPRLHMSKSQKERDRKALKKITKQAEIDQVYRQHATSGVALAGAHAIRKVTKGSSSKWASMLSGAAKVATELIPLVAPLLLAGHAPTQMAAAANGVTAPASAAAAPLATGMGAPTMVGLYDLKAIKGKSGKVIGYTVTGMDYLDDVTVPAAGTIQGAIVADLNLLPLSRTFSGTKFRILATTCERWRVNKMCAMYAPSVAATTNGALLAYFDTDPTDTDLAAGVTGVQQAAAHEGAEVFQVWQTGLAQYCPDPNSQDLFINPDGTDARLCSAGRLRFVAASDLAAGTYGGIYLMYQVTFTLPQIETANTESMWVWFKNVASGITASIPLGVGTYAQLKQSGNLDGYYVSDGGFYKFTGWHPGQYLVAWRATSGSSLSPVTCVTDNVNYTQNSGYATYMSTSASGIVIIQVATDTRGNPSLGNFYFTAAIAPSSFWFYVASFDPSFALSSPKQRTLQDYEQDVASMRLDIERLKALVPAQRAPMLDQHSLPTTGW